MSSLVLVCVCMHRLQSMRVCICHSSIGLSSETASSPPPDSSSPGQQCGGSLALLVLCVLLIMILWVKMGEDSLEELTRRLDVIIRKIGRMSSERLRVCMCVRESREIGDVLALSVLEYKDTRYCLRCGEVGV
ncbi:hypothetical protein E1301_Tti012001 [Triplophysa tibetana]|uniref:Uncharacterized protein n=1 Tax=Triplophysa tibetana TaxID=1572043 RepID=A0A5A9PMD9_9TELE|nr:hypothetical protein E1301_Tti012001 [Triplophysa tibetana]